MNNLWNKFSQGVAIGTKVFNSYPLSITRAKKEINVLTHCVKTFNGANKLFKQYF